MAPDDDRGLGEPFALADGTFRKRSNRLRRFKHVRQVDEMDCGAACLTMVCQHFGRKIPLSRIRQLVHTGQDGTNLRGLCDGATALGLAARAVRVPGEYLDAMPLPAILHWRGNHWVVLHGLDSQHAWIADPGTSLRRIPRTELATEWSGFAAVFDYTESFEDADEVRSGFAWLRSLLRPHAPLLWRGLGLALVVSALQMIFPVFTQIIVDRVLVEQDVDLLNALVATMAAVVVFMFAALYVQRYLLSFAAVRIDASSLDQLTRRLLSLPMDWFNRHRTGDIQRRLDGVRSIREYLVEAAVDGLSAVTQLAAALLVMSLYSPRLTLVFLAVAPLYVALMYYSANRLRPLFGSMEESFGRYQSQQIDAIKGIEGVKSLGAERGLRERLLQEFHILANRSFHADITVLGYQSAVQAVTFVTTLLVLSFGAREVLHGGMTVGAFVAFAALVAIAQEPIRRALALWDEHQLSGVLLERLSDIFDSEPEQGSDHSTLQTVHGLEGRIEVRNLGFRYGGAGDVPILDDIHLSVQPGQTIAIVGRSGSGKTTLAKCIGGLLEPSDGHILFDGLDASTLRHRDLRRQIGFVLQDSHLFDDTIANNIAFGETEPDMQRVMWAARAANAAEFIERLPLGYEAQVGESGLRISGGQAQRIAIARALYHKPSLLIFDEATSSLDTESERALHAGMDGMLAGRTAIIIAHRLSTIRRADLIVVLEQGRIVEQGTHEELLDLRGLYYYLSSQQLEM